MSVELRIRVEGDCECGVPHDIGWESRCEHILECDWGVIEHSAPNPATNEVGHLMLAAGWVIGGRLNRGPIPHWRGHGTTTVTNVGDRLFIHMDHEGRRWTWELFEAHFADGKGPDDLLVGRWPD